LVPSDSPSDSPSESPSYLLGCKTPQKCFDLQTQATRWGRAASGLDLRSCTGGTLEYIGCVGDGCDPGSFYCNDDETSITFGTNTGSGGVLRALLDEGNSLLDNDPGSYISCASVSHPNHLANAPYSLSDVVALCRALGYSSGELLSSNTNTCPDAVAVGGNPEDWKIDFTAGSGGGSEYRCFMVP
jgi:hypothetical protein